MLGQARTLGRALAGPAIFPGGREGLWQAIAERARELGADVLASDEAVERLVLEGSTVGVRLTKSDTIYRAGYLVAAANLDVLTRLIPEKQRKAAAKLLPSVAAQKALLTLNLVVPEKALPRGLGTLALVDAPAIDGGALLLQVGPATQADHRVLTVCLPAPLGLRAGGEPAIRALVAQVHAALARVMPFTKAHVTLESTPWIDAPARGGGTRRGGAAVQAGARGVAGRGGSDHQLALETNHDGGATGVAGAWLRGRSAGGPARGEGG